MKKFLAYLASGLAVPAVLICGALLYQGCAGTVTTAVNADAVVITSVNGAMQGWASVVNSGGATQSQVATVSNSYSAYLNSQLVLSNLSYAYTVTPSTNLSSAITVAQAALAASASNIVGIVNAFTSTNK